MRHISLILDFKRQEMGRGAEFRWIVMAPASSSGYYRDHRGWNPPPARTGWFV